MARYIESPGIQINEIDLSLNATLPVGTNILVNGFADSGPTQELLNITSLEEYKQVYGVPTNAAERYSYHTMSQILGTNAKVIFNRLPYGSEGGSGFNDSYTALLYPVYTVAVDASGDIVAGYSDSIAYSANPMDVAATTYHLIGKPSQIAITESQYSAWKAGDISWTNWSTPLSSTAGVSANYASAGNAGLIVVNKLKTSVNQDFEGYYVAMSDNLKSSTTTVSEDFTFDSISAVYTSKNAVSGATAAASWSSLSTLRLDFQLSGNSKVTGSLSESIESTPTWDFGSDSYNDAIILGVYKFRRSGYAPNENSLTYVPYETFIGSLGDDRKYTAPNSFQETSFSLEKLVSDGSAYLDVLVNPNLASGIWIDDSGKPNRKVRVLSSQMLDSLSTDAELSGNVSTLSGNLADAAFTLGLYQDKASADKSIGDVSAKLELGLTLAEDYEKYPLDLVLDAGLSTIFATTKVTSASEFDDTAALSAISSLSDPTTGMSSDIQGYWQVIFNQFDSFCRETRKDCFHIADCLRHQLILGRNQKILSDKSKNFSQHIYTPMKNLVSKSNSSYSAIYAQWIQVYDSASGNFAWVPFSGFQAAIMARVDANLYPWYAPAGLENGIVRGATDIALNTTQKQRDLLYRHNVNSVVFFPNDGIVTWGQKTLQKKPSAFDRINVRRLFLTLEKGTRSIMKYFVFQPNTVFTRTRVNNVLAPIFDVAKNNEGVYDYKIVADTRNNTPAVIDANELVVDIYLKPVRSAEFILVNFYATRTDQNFSELI
jgi:hypothetical protein